jgi:hypothetical protein
VFLALMLAVMQAASPPPVAGDTALRRTVADYVGLYKHETLDRWRTLFLPTFTEGSEKSRGKLVLLLVAEHGEWRIQSLMFSYEGE